MIHLGIIVATSIPGKKNLSGKKILKISEAE